MPRTNLSSQFDAQTIKTTGAKIVKRKTIMIITLKQLKEHGACPDQIALFKKLFGERVSVTKTVCLKYGARFNLNWAARELLSPTANKAYKEVMAPANKAYKEVMAPANKAYNEVMVPANKAYNEAMAPANKASNEAKVLAYKAYNEAMAPANKAYNEATAPAHKAYNEAMVLAFYRATKIK